MRLSFLFLFIFCYGYSQTEYSIKTLTENDSLSQNHIYTLIQDSRSFLWIGTGQGLSRYNGKVIANFNTSHGLAENFVTSSVKGNDESIFFGHYSGGITQFDGQGFSVYHKNEGNKVAALIHTEIYNELWSFHLEGKILRFDSEAKITKFEVPNLAEKVINSVKLIQDGFLIGTSEGLLHIAINANRELGEISSDSVLEFDNVTSIIERPDRNSYWVATEGNGIYQLNKHNRKLEKAFNDLLDGLSITAIAEDNYGVIWITSKEKGLQRLFTSKEGNIKELMGFTGEGAMASANLIYLDDEDGIWCGTKGEGLKLFAPQSFSFFDLNSALGTGDIYSSIEVNPDEYWIATENGLVQGKFIKNGNQYKFNWHPDKDLQRIQPKYLKSNPSNRQIWIASKNSGLAIYSLNNKLLKSLPDFNSTLVTFIEIDQLGRYWISAQSNGVYVLSKTLETINHYNTANGLLHNDISSICADQDGNIWFSSSAVGVFKLNSNGQFDYLTKDSKFPSYVVNKIMQAKDGAMWFATGGDGLIRLNRENIQIFKESEGILSSYVTNLLVDSDLNVWTIHRKGLSLLNTQFQNSIRTFGANQAIKEISNGNNFIFKDIQGDVWFASGGVLVKYNTRFNHFNLYKRKPFLSDIRLFHVHESLPVYSKDSTSDYIPRNIFLPYDKNHLSFYFLTVDLHSRSNLYYRYKLIGFEKEWTPPSQEATTTYTNLAPGEYTFVVAASDNPYTFPSEPLAYSFVIMKPYWEKWWFYILQVSIILFLFFTTWQISKTRTLNTTGIRALRIMVFVFLFIVFEYFHEFLAPYTKDFDNSAPVIRILINLLLAIVLLPVEGLLKRIFKVGSQTKNI